VRQWIRSSESARSIYWKLRALLHRLPKSHHEVLFRLKRRSEKFGWNKPGVFQFGWGAFEYASVGHLFIQYEEIFQKRHYAFRADVTNPVIVDCGGNIGLSAVWFKLNYPACRLSVFEPDPSLANLIETNLRAAGFADVECIRKAAWVKDGQIGFDFRGDDRGKIDAAASRTVESLDLAKWLPEIIDLLKLDIEGAEFEVIEHLCDTGAIRRVKNLVCELHVIRGTETKMLSLIQQLMGAGMQISMNYGAAVPAIGLANEASPFDVIARNHVLIELYAWQK
jgi:FkbM family methyltransferase